MTRAIAALIGVIVAIGERKRPLRKRTQAPMPRIARNLAIGAAAWSAAACCRLLIGPKSKRRRQAAALQVADILLLDYTLWWWHRWNHEWPLLWRFHRLHHEDRDLDASTGVRFHPAEQLLAQFFRLAQIRLIRPSKLSLELYETLLLSSILFHHSNWDVPVDQSLARWIVTPRMHGIHHAEDAKLSRSNYASLLSLWDSAHGTLRLDVPQDAITIGAP